MQQPIPAMTGIIPTHLPAELSEFVSVDYPPQDTKPVLVIRESGTKYSKYELLTLFYDPRHHPASPWRDIYGNSVHGRLLGWKNAHRWIQPVN